LKLAAQVSVLSCLILAIGCGDSGDGPAGPSNHPPVIQAQTDTSAAVGDTLVLWADAQDPDGDDLTYIGIAHITYEEFARGYFPHAGMHPTSGRFRFIPQADDAPRRRFSFCVDDGRGGEDSTTFTVNID
jgi:hypothetical protein